MGLYIANDEWRLIMSGATAALVSTTDEVHVFMGDQVPDAAEVGVILGTSCGLRNWDVSAFGGSMWIKGQGVVYTLADPAAQETASDGTGTTVPPVTPVIDKAPTITAADSLSGRTLTISTVILTGSPAPTATLTKLTLDGVDVLADATGSGPWQYAVPDDGTEQVVAWEVTASNGVSPDDTAAGAEILAAPAAVAPVLSGLTLTGGAGTLDARVTTDTAGQALVLSVGSPEVASVTIASGAVTAGSNTFTQITGLSAGTYPVTATQGGTTVTATVTVTGTATVAAGVGAPVYSGGALDIDTQANSAMTPADLSVHFTGAAITYSATGLPTGLSINSTTGVVSGTPTVTATSSVVVTATNAGGTATATFDVNVGGSSVAETASITSTAMQNGSPTGTIAIGDDVIGRDVYFSVITGGTTNAALQVNGSPATLVAEDIYPMRAVQIYKVTGLTGTTATYSGAGDNSFYIAAFSVVGYQPISGDPWETNRRTGNDTLTHNVLATVPIDGAVLLYGKKYDLLTASPTGVVIDESTTNGLRGYWLNESGREAGVRFTFATSSANSEKYAAGLILEKKP